MNNPPELTAAPDLPEEIRQAALDGKLVLFVGDVTEPRKRILSYLRSKSLAFVLIRRKNKSFVIGSNPVLQVFPERSDSMSQAFLAM